LKGGSSGENSNTRSTFGNGGPGSEACSSFVEKATCSVFANENNAVCTKMSDNGNCSAHGERGGRCSVIKKDGFEGPGQDGKCRSPVKDKKK